MSHEQPYVDHWPMFEEPYSKFPVLADITHARVKLARASSTDISPSKSKSTSPGKEHDRTLGRRR